MKEISPANFTIIIPSYNEEKIIKGTLTKLLEFFDERLDDQYEVIVVMDGCTDETPKIVVELAETWKEKLVPLIYPQRLGKGGAVISAAKHAHGNVTAFIDADLSASLDDLYALIRAVERFDLVVSSRCRPDSKVLAERSLIRRMLSRGFNALLKMLFSEFKDIGDTQCGAKAFKSCVIKSLSRDLFISDFAFDVNLIYSAMRHGFSVREIGITWSHRKSGSKLSEATLAKISISMFLSILRLRIYYSRFRNLLYANPVKKLAGLLFR